MDFDEFTAIVEHDRVRAAELVLKDRSLIHLRSAAMRETPLHWLAIEDKREAGLWLIQQGADVNTRNVSNGTPLHDTATCGYVEMCRLLLDHGARTDLKDENEDTPLYNAAVRSGNRELFELLLSRSSGEINGYFSDCAADTILMTPDTEIKKRLVRLGLKPRDLGPMP